MKRAEDLGPQDLQAFPVWEFVNYDSLGETIMQPVASLPVRNFDNRLIGVVVRLANSDQLRALLGNIDVSETRRTRHFLSVTVFKNSRSFTLSRYHDPDYPEHGPRALADFLGLKPEEVFPIAYDLRAYCLG